MNIAANNNIAAAVELRQKIDEHLTPEQRAEAQRLAEELAGKIKAREP